MPRGASLPGPLAEDDDLWLPARMTPAERINEDSHNYRFLGRLADGVTLEQASAELDTFAARMASRAAVAPDDGGEAGAGRRADRARHQTDAAADRRQRRIAAAGRQRQRVDAAAGARVQPAARAGGPHGARRDARPAVVAGRRRVARLRVPRRSGGTLPRRLGAARGAAAVCRLAARRPSRSTSTRACAVFTAAPLRRPRTGVRRRRRRSTGRTAGSSTC